MCIKVQKSKHLSPEHTHNQSSHEEQSMTSTEESSALRWEPAGGWSVSTWEGSHNTFILTRTIVGKCYFQKFIFKSQHKKWKKHIYNGKTPLVKVLLFPNNHILFLSNYNQRNRSKNEYMKCPHYITTIRSCINTPEGSGSSTAFLISGLWKDSICTAISQWWEVRRTLKRSWCRLSALNYNQGMQAMRSWKLFSCWKPQSPQVEKGVNPQRSSRTSCSTQM